MTDSTISPAGSPLRRRMIEDMTVRGFTASTQRGYIRAIRDFTSCPTASTVSATMASSPTAGAPRTWRGRANCSPSRRTKTRPNLAPMTMTRRGRPSPGRAPAAADE